MREVLFVTGTRADFGKLRDIIRAVQDHPRLSARVVVTGMHLLRRYGYTVHEIERCGLNRLHLIPNQVEGEPVALVLANTVQALARLVHEERPAAIVVHGDRVEALAGALVGSLTDVLVVHIEGGEVAEHARIRARLTAIAQYEQRIGQLEQGLGSSLPEDGQSAQRCRQADTSHVGYSTAEPRDAPHNP